MKKNNDRKNLLIATGVVVTVFIIGLGAITQDWNTGHNNLVDYTRAEMGDPKIQYQLGLKAAAGAKGMTGDVPQIDWFEKSASHGYAPAMLALGDLYNADPDEDSGDKAVKWYQKAADAGNAEGMRKLGEAYAMGRGTLVPDYAKARALYEKAAKGGDPEGETLFGVTLANEHNYTEGEAWLLKGEAAGDIHGDVGLGNIYYADFSPLKDDAKAAKYYGKAANAGATSIMLNYANMYYTGTGVTKDPAEAYKWVLIAQQRKVTGLAYAVYQLEGQLTPEQVNDGKQRANTWLQTHPAKDL